jgi:hypothetical protein
MGGESSKQGRDKKHIKNWCKSLKGRDHLEDLDVDGRIILQLIFVQVWNGFIWLRTGTSDNNLVNTPMKFLGHITEAGNFLTI